MTDKRKLYRKAKLMQTRFHALCAYRLNPRTPIMGERDAFAIFQASQVWSQERKSLGNARGAHQAVFAQLFPTTLIESASESDANSWPQPRTTHRPPSLPFRCRPSAASPLHGLPNSRKAVKATDTLNGGSPRVFTQQGIPQIFLGRHRPLTYKPTLKQA